MHFLIWNRDFNSYPVTWTGLPPKRQESYLKMSLKQVHENNKKLKNAVDMLDEPTKTKYAYILLLLLLVVFRFYICFIAGVFGCPILITHQSFWNYLHVCHIHN